MHNILEITKEIFGIQIIYIGILEVGIGIILIGNGHQYHHTIHIYIEIN